MKNLTRPLCALAAALCLVAARADDGGAQADAPRVKPGETVVLIGDSITEQAYRIPWGYYHALTNAAPGINFIPLGFSGYQVKGWSDMERASVTNADVWTWYRNPGWNLKSVFDGKVDAVVIFLGMNDILQPSIRDDAADVARWLHDYATFVRNLRARARPREMIFATITPLTADPASPKNRVRERLNNRLRMLAALTGARVADFGAAIDGGLGAFRAIDPDYRLVPDFVHPNALGHLMIAEELCAELGLADAADALAARIEDRTNDLADRSADLVATVALDRSCRPDDPELVYNLSFNVADAGRGILPETRVLVPAGWSVDEKLLIGVEGTFRLRGTPSSLTTRVVVEASVPTWDESSDGPTGAETLRAFVDIPAPWKLRDERGGWTVYGASGDYTGGAAPGSIDPFQLYFGWKDNTVQAYRRVWSEKARDVTAVLSHQTFSATLELAVSVNGREVWKDRMDRHGRNRLEKRIHLDAGWNPIEITCTNHDWQRQFAFDLLPLDGDDLSRLRYDLK